MPKTPRQVRIWGRIALLAAGLALVCTTCYQHADVLKLRDGSIGEIDGDVDADVDDAGVIDADASTDADHDAEVTDADLDAEIFSDADHDADAEPDVYADADEDAEISSDAEADAEADVEMDTEADVEVDTEADVEADVEGDAEVDVDEDTDVLSCDGVICHGGCCSLWGECLSPSMEACGTHGSTCVECNPLVSDHCGFDGRCYCGWWSPCRPGQNCSWGSCICDRHSCPGGCCDDGRCVEISREHCGREGGVCFACDPTRADRCTFTGECSCQGGDACDWGWVCGETGCER